jgi:hypothetical protein
MAAPLDDCLDVGAQEIECSMDGVVRGKLHLPDVIALARPAA